MWWRIETPYWSLGSTLQIIAQSDCYGLTCGLHTQPKSYVETLISKVTIFGDMAFREIIEVKRVTPKLSGLMSL